MGQTRMAQSLYSFLGPIRKQLGPLCSSPPDSCPAAHPKPLLSGSPAPTPAWQAGISDPGRLPILVRTEVGIRLLRSEDELLHGQLSLFFPPQNPRMLDHLLQWSKPRRS